MEKIIPNGTKVLIFNYNPSYSPKQDERHLIMGIIKESETKEISTLHGSPWNVQAYKVLGEDGTLYYGTYDKGIVGNNYFRTIEDHIEFIKNIIKSNYETISELNDKNIDLYDYIENLTDTLYEQESDNETYEETNTKEFKSISEATIFLAKKNAEKYKKRKIN